MSASRVIAELTLAHPELVLAPTIEAVPEVSAELEYQTIAGPGEYYLFFEVYGGDFGRFDRAIADDPTVSEPSIIIDGGDFRVYRMRLTSAERLVLPRAAELGMRVLRAESAPGGWAATLEVPDLDDLRAFREHCRDKDVDVIVDRLYHADDTSAESGGAYGLTAVQRETLAAAYDAGYFNEPRDASVADLADRLGISSSAASSRLRRAMRALVQSTLRR
ncbi:helix-turn-helix domain-containing protein [Halopiger xanaduensis]|uniref:Bacterio-opsin activator HTH domain protein n=1 Tax=Halopiger xanaduensis (strain DSM 18323 / JCM 14033 / SH-6) TaxID=797210 RepID=F8D5R5_HALXS|nr:helix-turn-helix domain-containing protein [Halopiger xanaduensis]AEH36487.1 Bacterio-opsin activator HTH domain protein [Halopiger xanaduensis SH-6]